MKRIEVRGMVVYLSPQGESHKRAGIYTEEGMLYFTLYGARSTKGQLKKALSLFTMGRFVFNIKKQETYDFIDLQMYESGISLSQHIDAYYSACAGAELVRAMIGAEHDREFKLLVDLVLFLIENPAQWMEVLIVFLWQSLAYNGWQPQIEDLEPNVYYHKTKDVLDCLLSREGTRCIMKDWAQEIMGKTASEKQYCINLLFDVWHNIIGYKLRLAEFLVRRVRQS